ncbi:MAG: class I SAM-dependent rRNA methyltransferase [bacterium]
MDMQMREKLYKDHMGLIILKPGRERCLRSRHPWIFSGAIQDVKGLPKPGETVRVLDSGGQMLGVGAYSPSSQIAVRIWTFIPDETVSSSFFAARLQRAVSSRGAIGSFDNSAAARLVNAESDGLPGLIVDCYANFLVCQFLSTGPDYWKQIIVDNLNEIFPRFSIYERSDVEVREKEGLQKCAGVLSGNEPPKLINIREGPYQFLVDIKHGHKTGFYLDQSENRAFVAEYAGKGEVLNCFAYTGGFGVAALKAGADRITNVESSRSALLIAERNFYINGLDMEKVDNVEDDVFLFLRRCRDSRRQFDSVILDPPKFAESRNQVKGACRGYKDINLLAFKMIKPGGTLITFSCSGLIGRELFEKIVAGAMIEAGREAQIIRRLSQAPDHPSSLSFPESNYLKGLVCRVW